MAGKAYAATTTKTGTQEEQRFVTQEMKKTAHVMTSEVAPDGQPVRGTLGQI